MNQLGGGCDNLLNWLLQVWKEAFYGCWDPKRYSSQTSCIQLMAPQLYSKAGFHSQTQYQSPPFLPPLTVVCHQIQLILRRKSSSSWSSFAAFSLAHPGLSSPKAWQSATAFYPFHMLPFILDISYSLVCSNLCHAVVDEGQTVPAEFSSS